MEIPVLPPSDYNKRIGYRLRLLIKVLGLRLIDAAADMGVSKHVLNHWLLGHHPVQPYPLYRFCKIRDVDFNFVYLGDDSRLPEDWQRALVEAGKALSAEAREQVPHLVENRVS